MVLVVFVAELVGWDVGAGFGVADVLHLMGSFFYTYFAEVPQGAQDCRHGEVVWRTIGSGEYLMG